MRYLFALLCLSASMHAAKDPASQPPNIVFILADDVGQEVLGCYGGESYRTPVLDGFAREGARFEFAFSMPVCHPTRISLLTGHYPVQLGNAKWGSFPRAWEASTFASVMKRAGYATAVAGKWQLTLLKKDLQQPHRMGFDHYCLFGWHEGPRYWKPFLWQDGKKRDDVADRYGPDVYCDFLIDFMKENREKPFLAFFSMALCHDVADDFKPLPPFGPGKDRYESFAEMVHEMDRVMGRLLKGIDALGLRENTIVIFTTDNGSPGRSIAGIRNGKQYRDPVVSKRNGLDVPGGKGSLKDSGTRVPLLVRWPGRIAAGQVISDSLVDSSMFMNAFLQVGGAEANDGTSFIHRAMGERSHAMNVAYAEGRGGAFWIRNKRWKVYPKTARLFDIQKDPLEKKPVDRTTLSKEQAQRVKALEELAPEFRRPVGNP